jgi:hypothetical protein
MEGHEGFDIKNVLVYVLGFQNLMLEILPFFRGIEFEGEYRANKFF